ncbi:imelysin family protein [Kistimonas scapharcae]
MKKVLPILAISAVLAGCGQNDAQDISTSQSSQINPSISHEAIVEQYANVAHATFEDALLTARALHTSISTLIKSPTEANLDAAKAAWIAARVPYQQSEVFRFGNAVVDDWEGQLNAWPLDEGLIDYVDNSAYQAELGNAGAAANIIANLEIQVGNDMIDTSHLAPSLLANLNELGGSEANVTTGYHAIEFLLWGQDLNGTEPGAGNRPASDYATGDDCTNGHCERRAQYLTAAAELLVIDLETMEAQWRSGQDDNYRQTLLSEPAEQGLRKMLFGMGSLALGELAGERMKVALEANSTEDEHDCFSDNTHNSHFYNALGINNVYSGSYTRVDGTQISGPSLADLAAAENPEQASAISSKFVRTQAALQAMVNAAEQGQAFDQLIAANNKEGNAIVEQAISALVEETAAIEQLAALAGINNLSPDTADHTF